MDSVFFTWLLFDQFSIFKCLVVKKSDVLPGTLLFFLSFNVERLTLNSLVLLNLKLQISTKNGNCVLYIVDETVEIEN